MGKIDNLTSYPLPRENLYYLSCHTLDSSQFGKARVHREVTDQWLACELEHKGLRFNADAPDLTESELASIPGAQSVLSSIDSLKLEVLNRRGTSFVINGDEERKWSSLADTSSEFEELKKHHDSTFKDTLAYVVKIQNVDPRQTTATGGSATSAVGPPDAEDGNEEGAAAATEYLEYGSMDECKAILYSETDRQLTRGVQVGGYGTGTYTPSTESSQGVELCYPDGDKTKVQLEESSVKKDSSNNPTMSLYQLLILIERQFKVATHKISYTEVERTADGSGRDTFSVKLSKNMMYKFVEDDRGETGESATKKTKKDMTGKGIFRFKHAAVQKSDTLSTAFRFRYEKIGQSLKLMKPYVILTKNLKLQAKKPLEALNPNKLLLVG